MKIVDFEREFRQSKRLSKREKKNKTLSVKANEMGRKLILMRIVQKPGTKSLRQRGHDSEVTAPSRMRIQRVLTSNHCRNVREQSRLV